MKEYKGTKGKFRIKSHKKSYKISCGGWRNFAVVNKTIDPYFGEVDKEESLANAMMLGASKEMYNALVKIVSSTDFIEQQTLIKQAEQACDLAINPDRWGIQ